jgi:glycosyltransferase involved in cell wall biosynthesis
MGTARSRRGHDPAVCVPQAWKAGNGTSAANRVEAVRLQPPAMRIVHVTTAPMALMFLRGQVGYMKARGLDVAAVSSPGEELDRFGHAQDVPVYAVSMPRRMTPIDDLRALVQLTRLLRELQPAVVHSHTPKGGLLGTLAGLFAGVPVRVYHMRGLPFMTRTGVERAILQLTERVSCLVANHVLCVSRSLRDVALDEHLCPPEKIEVLAGGSGNGVDAAERFSPLRVGAEERRATRARFGIPDDAVVIGFVGRLVRDKGIVELMVAFQRLAARFPEVHLLVVGGVEEQRDPIPAEAEAQLRGGDRVHWAGFDWDAPPLYAAMDVVALPTYREGFPNVPLEAAAMGLPVVATRIPGCIDAVAEGQTGLLVPPGDAAALEEALARYLADPALRRTHGDAGRARVQMSFRQEVIWDALYRRYRMLADSAAAR